MKTFFFQKLILGISVCALLFMTFKKERDIEQAKQKYELDQAKAYADKLGYNPDDISIGEFAFPDGTFEDRIFIDRDIAISTDDFYALENVNSIADQYYSTNLEVTEDATIEIVGFTGGSNGLTDTQRKALRLVVNNYNRLNGGSGTYFNLTFGTNYSDEDMVIYRNPSNSDAGGSAGFPSNGRTNKFVQLYAGLDNYGVNVNEHVITREIGHSIGFRSDYVSR